MLLREKIEQYLKEILELENSFSKAQEMEILPLSFFSSSIDILHRLKTGIFEIEEIQLQIMQEHLKRSKSEWTDTNEFREAQESRETIELKNPEPEEKITLVTTVLAGTFEHKVDIDSKKPLSVNDRFRKEVLHNRFS